MATAVSGTGPTYVFLVMEALIDAAVHLGFPRHIAHDLVIETLEGSTLFAKQSGMHPAELRNMVTSPGGTSAAALHELESGRLRTVLSEAVWAAYRRTVELGDQLEASVGLRGRAPERRLTTTSTRTRASDAAHPVDLQLDRRAPPDADRTHHAVAQPDDRGDRRGRGPARVPSPPARPAGRLHRGGRRRTAALHARVCAVAIRASSPPRRSPSPIRSGRPTVVALAFVRDDEIWVIEADGSRLIASCRQARRRSRTALVARWASPRLPVPPARLDARSG